MIAVDVDKLKGEIADLKATIQTPSCDYVTGYISALSVVEGMIATLPTLTLDDLRPKGRWIHKHSIYDSNIYICSNCKEQISILGNKVPSCPYCIADMRGGRKE